MKLFVLCWAAHLPPHPGANEESGQRLSPKWGGKAHSKFFSSSLLAQKPEKVESQEESELN